MNAVTALFHKNLQANIGKICTHLVSGATSPDTPLNVTHPGQTVSSPSFTVARLLLVTLLAEIISHRPSRTEDLPCDLWTVLSGWFFEYTENNMYQCQFFRLFFQVLRANDEKAIKELFKVRSPGGLRVS